MIPIRWRGAKLCFLSVESFTWRRKKKQQPKPKNKPVHFPADWRTHHKIFVQSDAKENSDISPVTKSSEKLKPLNLKHLNNKIVG